MKKIKFFLVVCLAVMSLGVTGCSKKDGGYNYFMENYKYLDDKENVFVSVSYKELLGLLDSDESFVLYFGGAWCPNCQAAVPFINEVAKQEKITKVYSFDTRLDQESKELDIRKCNDEKQTKMWETIITKLNYSSENKVMVNEEVVLGSNGNPISAMSVPTVFAVSKGEVKSSLTKEYIYNDMTEEDKSFYKNELKKLMNLIK